MVAHDHSTLVPGCYRCELGRDEADNAARENADLVIDLQEQVEELEAENAGLRDDVEALNYVLTLAKDERSRIALVAENEGLRAANEALLPEVRTWRHRALVQHLDAMKERPEPGAISTEHGKQCCGVYRPENRYGQAAIPCDHAPDFRIGDLYACRFHIYRTVKNLLPEVGDEATVARVAD